MIAFFARLVCIIPISQHRPNWSNSRLFPYLAFMSSAQSLTAEQRFRRTVLRYTLSGLLVFLYIIIADFLFPLTPQSRVYFPISEIAPDVSGEVLAVNVKNNQQVNAGDALFSIDSMPYAQRVTAARLALAQAKQHNATLSAQIQAAKAQVMSAKAQYQEALNHANRIAHLDASVISQDSKNAAFAARDQALASLKQQEADLHALIVERGNLGEDNLALKIAKNNLAIAERNLQHTTVRAATAGKITNLQLHVGDYANQGQAVMALVQDAPLVTADFREKALSHVRPGDKAFVSFDAIPGRVFSAKVEAIESGIGQGQLAANGQLASTTETDRWLRRAERLRIDVRLDKQPDFHVVSGSRSTVQLVPHDNWLALLISKAQIHLVALMHYVY